jgi:hypothetical protein
MLMERVAEVIRGWPYDGSLDRYEPIKSGSTLVNGDWVVKQSDGTVDKAGSTNTSTASVATGMVVVGNGDSGSAAYSSKAVVLWGNFIVRVSNYAAGAYVPGSPVTAKNGVISLATPGTDQVIGQVLDVVTAVAGTTTANLVIRIN